MEEILARWQSLYPFEETFVYTRYGVPSLIVRFDGVLDENGDFRAYEIQDGAGGLGYGGIAFDQLKHVRDRFAREKWLPFSCVLGPRTLHHDDALWLPSMTIDQALQSDDLVTVRSELRMLNTEGQRLLIRRAVGPVKTHGDKQYGVTLGWWREIAWHEAIKSELPWNDAFVVKPVRGTGGRDVHIWAPPYGSSRRQILGAIQRRGRMIVQEYIPPMSLEINGQSHNLIVRPFFGYDPQVKTWVSLHGLWTARPGYTQRIHGASDAVCGPVVME